MPMRIFSHRHENLFSWAREFRLFVTPRSRVGQGVFAYTVNPDTPSRPGQTSFSWLQEVFPIGAKRAFPSAGFVFSRLTAAACALPAGNKVHSSDSSLPTAIFRIKGATVPCGPQVVENGRTRERGGGTARQIKRRRAAKAPLTLRSLLRTRSLLSLRDSGRGNPGRRARKPHPVSGGRRQA